MQLDQKVISIQYGDVDGDYNCEKVVLYGTPSNLDQNYMQQVEVMVHYMDDRKLCFLIDMVGYDLQLFIGDFLKVNHGQILITGRTGGQGDSAVVGLYQLEGNQLKLIVDEADLSKKLTAQVGYINMNGALGVTCPATGQTFMLEANNTLTSYPMMNYNLIQPTISTIYTIYPIRQPYESYYCLQIQQLILGTHQQEVLGGIQSVIQLTQEVPIIKNQALLKWRDA